MDNYTLQSTVKNGQLIIDLPMDFNNQDVEVTISTIVKIARNGETPMRNYLDLIPNKRAFNFVDRLRSESWGGDDFVRTPTQTVDWDALEGSVPEPKSET